MKFVFLLALSPLVSSIASGASYAISNIGKTELVGSTAAVPDSGTTSNFSTGTIAIGSSFANFQLVQSGMTTRVADLRITVVGVTGTLDTAGGKSGLMIAQTSNSQGLTDAGTLSILSSFSAAAGGESSISLRFDFYQPDTTTLMNLGIELTSFDYDFKQFMRVNNSDFTDEAHGSRLTRTSSGGTTKWSDDGNTDSTFTDSRNAVVLNNVADSSFQITVGKAGTGNSLYMFEFRDPSQILNSPLTPVPLPEVSTSAIRALGGLTVLRRKR